MTAWPKNSMPLPKGKGKGKSGAGPAAAPGAGPATGLGAVKQEMDGNAPSPFEGSDSMWANAGSSSDRDVQVRSMAERMRAQARQTHADAQSKELETELERMFPDTAMNYLGEEEEHNDQESAFGIPQGFGKGKSKMDAMQQNSKQAWPKSNFMWQEKGKCKGKGKPYLGKGETAPVDMSMQAMPVGMQAMPVGVPELSLHPGMHDPDREAKVRAAADRIRAETKQSAVDIEAKDHEKEMRLKAENEERTKKQEEEDAKKLAGFLPQVQEKVTAAEDDAEKISILAAPLEMDPMEELREMQLEAVREVERAVQAATFSTTLARQQVERRMREADGYAPMAKETAKEELGKLLERLDAGQEKLNDHRTARKDYELAYSANRAFGDLAEQLAGEQIECEKAVLMAEPLAQQLDADANEVSPSDIRETKDAIRTSLATLAKTSRMISGKSSGLKGAVNSKFNDLQARVDETRKDLEKAQKALEEAEGRATAAPILQKVADKIAPIDDMLAAMLELETPFLIGNDLMGAEEAEGNIKKMQRGVSKTEMEFTAMLKDIDWKEVEIGRLAEGAAESARLELEKFKEKVEKGLERVQQFRKSIGARRRTRFVEAIANKMAQADKAIATMKESGSKVSAATPESLAEAVEKARVCEIEAKDAAYAVRQELQDQPDALEGESQDGGQFNSDVVQARKRLEFIEGEISRHTRLTDDSEEKVHVKQSLADIWVAVDEADAAVVKVQDTAKGWNAGELAPEEDEKSVDRCQSKLSGTIAEAETKMQHAKGLELVTLRDILGRLSRSQDKLDMVKMKALDRRRALSVQVAYQCGRAIQDAEKRISEMNAAAKQDDKPLEAMRAEAAKILDVVAQAKKEITKGDGGAALVPEVRVHFNKLLFKFRGVERAGQTAANNLWEKYERVASEATKQALDALRSQVKDGDEVGDSTDFFNQLSAGESTVSEEQFFQFFKKYEEDQGFTLPQERLKIAFKRIAPQGLTRHVLASCLSEFYRAAHDITLTDVFEIKSTKTIRKLSMGEYLEALGSPKEDTTLGLQRLHCRAVRDGTKGWATLKSASGKVFLEQTGKPYVWCQQNGQIRKAPDETSAVIRTTRMGEVLEVLEGPREQEAGAEMWLEGVSCREKTKGWLQVSSGNGLVQLAKQSDSVYKCEKVCTMTEQADSAEVVCELEPGEVLEAVADEAEVASESSSRRKFRVCKDNKEGWITVKDKDGTGYVKALENHYVCNLASHIHEELDINSQILNTLSPGEVFEANGVPKEIIREGGSTVCRVKGLDGADGWVASKIGAEQVQPWNSRYKILKPVDMTRGFSASEAADTVEVVRALEVDELVDIIEHPAEDPSSGLMRSRCVALRDKLEGCVTVAEGTAGDSILMRPILAAEDGRTSMETVDDEEPHQEANARASMHHNDRHGKGGGKRRKGRW